MLLNETNVNCADQSDIADYIAMRLNWRSARKQELWKGSLPEYDPCVIQSSAEGDERAGVLFAWDPNVMEVKSSKIIWPGRVLMVTVAMLDDGLRYNIFVCYTPCSNETERVHKEVWDALTESLIGSALPCIVAGDLNAETAGRLLKAGIDLRRKGAVPKRKGEPYLYRLMHCDALKEDVRLKRIGPEKQTFRHVTRSATETEPEVVGSQIIDHVLADCAASRCKAGGTSIIQTDLVQFHLAVGFHIVTVADEAIKRKSSLKPKLGRMPQASVPSSRTRSKKSLGKRAVDLARNLPELAVAEDGQLVDDVSEAGDSELEEPAEDDDPEPIGYELFKLIAAERVEEVIKDYVANRVLAEAEGVSKRGPDATQHEKRAAGEVAKRVFEAKHGTAIDYCIRETMRTARDVIGAPQASGRKLSESQRAKRRMEFFIHMESLVDDMEASPILFNDTGRLPKRWLARGNVHNAELHTLFGGCSIEVEPAARKQKELAIIRAQLREAQNEYDSLRAKASTDYAVAQLEMAMSKEPSFGRAAAELLRKERPGAVSRKDRGPGTTLTALRDEANPDSDALITGSECDELVAKKVAKANRVKRVDLEAVGHLMDLTGFQRGSELGGPSARVSGAIFQSAEVIESRRRWQRAERKRALRSKVREPPVGDYVTVGNYRYPEPKHTGRVHLDAMRGSILGNCFSMGDDGHDEQWRATVCACYRDWLDTGSDAYEIAEQHGLPLEYVSSVGGAVNPKEIESELTAIVNMVVELGDRVLLVCCCSPAQCHLEEVARRCNLRIADALGAQSEGIGAGGAVDAEEGVDAPVEPTTVRRRDEGEEGDVAPAEPTAERCTTEAEASDGEREREAEWTIELDKLLLGLDIDEEERERMRRYWREVYFLEYDERDDLCVDPRVRSLLEEMLTAERVMELSSLVKEKLATGLDEFNARLISKGGIELAALFAAELQEEIANFNFPESWSIWHATLIPKPGKDRCKLSGWREIWLQAHLWKLVVGAVLPKTLKHINASRPWCNAGFEALRGCPEMSRALRGRVELAMLYRVPLHLYFQDYAVFFPSLSRQLVAFILHELGVPSEQMQLLREMQDQVKGCFKTSRGPTRLAPMLRGEPMGAVEAPPFSIAVAALVQRALEHCLPGTPLHGREALARAIIALWYADDACAPEQHDRVLQGIIDGMVLISKALLELTIGHDEVEASKSASMSFGFDHRGNFGRDENTRFRIPVGKKMADVLLAVASSYRYLGISFDPELDMRKVEDAYERRGCALMTLVGNLGGATCDQLVQACNHIKQGALIFPARTLPISAKAPNALDIAAIRLLVQSGCMPLHMRRLGVYMPVEGGGMGMQPAIGTVVCADIDEDMRATQGRRGEPARAINVALKTATAARLGWPGPCAGAPTPFDFQPSHRWRPLLSERVGSEATIRHLLDYGLRMHGTGRDECAVDATDARDSTPDDRASTGRPALRLIDLDEVTLSMRLHGLGIQSVEDWHAGNGEIMSISQICVIFWRPGSSVSNIDRAHLVRQRDELCSSAVVDQHLALLADEGRAMSDELVLLSRLHKGRVEAIGKRTAIIGILWCHDDEARGERHNGCTRRSC